MQGNERLRAAYCEHFRQCAPKGWEALEGRLQPQNFASVAPHRANSRLALTVATSVVAVVVAGSAVFITVDRRGSANGTERPINLRPQASSRAAGSSAPAQGGQAPMNLPMMPAEPFVISYNHRLYITNSVFGDKASATPGALIGYGGGYGVKDIPVCAVAGEDISQSVCLKNTYDSSANNYLKYDFLCSDVISAGGRSYHLTGGINGSDSNILIVSTPGSPAVSSAAGADDYLIDWNFMASLNSSQQSVQAILGPELGALPGGGEVYAIDEIDPSMAVYAHIVGDLLTITKASGYTGKTIEDVMQDKGINIKQSVYN